MDDPLYLRTCELCGQTFETWRADATICSHNCAINLLTELSVIQATAPEPDDPDNVTITPDTDPPFEHFWPPDFDFSYFYK